MLRLLDKIKKTLGLGRYSDTAHPSWRVIYVCGRSVPLRYNDARTRCRLYGGLRLEYARDKKGDLLP